METGKVRTRRRVRDDGAAVLRRGARGAEDLVVEADVSPGMTSRNASAGRRGSRAPPRRP